VLESERRVIESPMSLNGSLHRLTIWWEDREEGWRAVEPRWKRWTLFTLIATGWIAAWLVWWVVILALYVLVAVTFLWVPFLVWRGFRRGSRRADIERIRHRELLERMNPPA
jgi:Flp pilus assembly protein TadB